MWLVSPNGSKNDFWGDPIFESASWFFVIILDTKLILFFSRCRNQQIRQRLRDIEASFAATANVLDSSNDNLSQSVNSWKIWKVLNEIFINSKSRSTQPAPSNPSNRRQLKKKIVAAPGTGINKKKVFNFLRFKLDDQPGWFNPIQS